MRTPENAPRTPAGLQCILLGMFQIPAMRKHARGQYFVRFAGKWVYFGTNLKPAEAAYVRWISEVYMPAMQASEHARAMQTVERSHKGGKALLIVDLVHMYLEELGAIHRRPETIDTVKRCLRHLLAVYGTMPARKFTPSMLMALRRDLQNIRLCNAQGEPVVPAAPKYAPKTLNHFTVAIKAVFHFGGSIGAIPPISFAGVKSITLERREPVTFTRQQVAELISKATSEWLVRKRFRPGADYERIGIELGHWLSLNYLAAMRPSNVVRLVHMEGRWKITPGPHSGGGVYELHRSKTTNSRHIILSSEAVGHLESLIKMGAAGEHARWKLESSYALAVRKVLGAIGWPHPLRHSAATHLGEAGVSQEDIANILGHCTPGALRNYLQISHTHLLPAVSRLTLRSSVESPSS